MPKYNDEKRDSVAILTKKDLMRDIFQHQKIDQQEIEESPSADYYFDIVRLQNTYATEDQIRDVARAMVKFFLESEDGISLRAFVVASKISLSTLERWAKKYDFFGESWNICKDIIAHRKDYGAHVNAFNANYVKASMPFYASEYREEKDKELNKKQEEKEDIKVLVEKFKGNNE